MRVKLISSVLLLLLPLFALAQEPVFAQESAAAQTVDADTLERIQSEALHAYTPEMMLKMYGSEELPEAAKANAEASIDELIDVLNVEKGRFYPFLLEDLTTAFETYIEPGTRFLDLGSGDGRVVFYAAMLGAEASGIEYDPEVFSVGERAQEALGDILEDKSVRLVQDDFFNHSWAGYDVIFYFDLGSFDRHQLRKKIFSELDPGARLIVGHQRIPFPGLELETTFSSLHVYRQAEELAAYDPKLQQYAEKEVRDLYAFFEGWYNGEIEKNDENLARYADVLESGFQLIDSRGGVVSRTLALDVLRGTHGKWRDDGEPVGKIRLENFALRFIQGAVVAVTFDEHHEARGKSNKLKTTAVFRLRHGNPNQVEWLHVHQSDLRLVIIRRAGESSDDP